MADGDGGQAGRDEIDFIDLIVDRPAGSILSPLSKNAAGSGMKANAHGFNSSTDSAEEHELSSYADP